MSTNKTDAKVIALIPARSGSKSIKDKNIQLVEGYPLLAWSIALAKLIDVEPVVSTDSKMYADIARKYGAEAIMRPAELATDTSTDLDYLTHFLRFFQPELILLLRPTTPLREVDVVKQALKEFKPVQYTALRSAHETAESAFKYYLLNTQGDFVPLIGFTVTEDNNLPRQMLPKIYHPNGYVDILQPAMIKEGQVYGNRIQPFFIEDPIEIDDFLYLEIVRFFAHRKKTGILSYLQEHYDADL